MRQKPSVMIVADPKANEIAVKEAKRLGVKVIGIVDTNNDPSSVDIAIPANDDSAKSLTLIFTILADAITGQVKVGQYRVQLDELGDYDAREHAESLGREVKRLNWLRTLQLLHWQIEAVEIDGFQHRGARLEGVRNRFARLNIKVVVTQVK